MTRLLLLALNVPCNEGDGDDDDVQQGDVAVGDDDDGKDYTAPGHDTSTDPGSADNN